MFMASLVSFVHAWCLTFDATVSAALHGPSRPSHCIFFFFLVHRLNSEATAIVGGFVMLCCVSSPELIMPCGNSM